MVFHLFAPLPVALVKLGVAYVGSCSSRATMSLEMLNGLAAPVVVLLFASPSRLLPRVRPHHSWLGPRVAVLALSVAGSGAVPLLVCPYQILLIAVASARFTQFALVLVPVTPLPVTPLHSTLGSLVGS